MEELKNSQVEATSDIKLPEDLKQIEDKMLTEFDPMEAAAKLFHIYLPQFKVLVNKMKVRQLKRLVSALIEVPLHTQEYKHPTQEEKAAYLLGDRLLQAKWVMILDTLYKKQNEENQPTPSEIELKKELESASALEQELVDKKE